MKLSWLASCHVDKQTQVKDVFVKAEIYSQSMFTQMSNALCFKLKLASSLHLPNLMHTALFIKLPETTRETELHFFLQHKSFASCACCLDLYSNTMQAQCHAKYHSSLTVICMHQN